MAEGNLFERTDNGRSLYYFYRKSVGQKEENRIGGQASQEDGVDFDIKAFFKEHQWTFKSDEEALHCNTTNKQKGKQPKLTQKAETHTTISFFLSFAFAFPWVYMFTKGGGRSTQRSSVFLLQANQQTSRKPKNCQRRSVFSLGLQGGV